VLTKDILFGMNILTLAGFVVMGITLTLNRMGQTRKAFSVGLMVTGTALVFLGLYAGGWSGRVANLAREHRECSWRRSGSSPPGFRSTYKISYRGLKLPSISAALARGAGPICRRWAVINLWPAVLPPSICRRGLDSFSGSARGPRNLRLSRRCVSRVLRSPGASLAQPASERWPFQRLSQRPAQ